MSCKKENVEDKLTAPKIDTLSHTDFEQMVLLEPFTSTSCGACPIAHHEIESIELQNDQVIHLTHYLYGPLNHEYTNYIIDQVNKTLYTPLSFIQRDNGASGVVYYAIDRLFEIIEGELKTEVALGLSVETSRVDQDVTLEITLNSNDMLSNESVALTVLVVENTVVGIGSGFDQRNYGHTDENHPYFNQGEYIKEFEHTNVIRHVMSAFDGDVVEFNGTTAAWTGSFKIDILPNELEAYSVIAFASESAKVGSPILNAALILF